MARPRLLSHSEIETALTCWARHAFAYTGHLTGGTTLKPRLVTRTLREGRAHGAAVARWHEKGNTLLASIEAGEALRDSLEVDELAMAEAGIMVSAEDRVNLEAHLYEVFAHYTTIAEPMPGLHRIEDEIIVPIPSRAGRHSSNRFRFQCFIDGWWEDEHGRAWLVEFKLRGRLHSVQLISTSRQLRWYAWALRKAKGIEPVGVLLDQRWNVAPAPARIVNAKRKGEGIEGKVVSHATNQHTTPEAYEYACAQYAIEPHDETLEHLRSIVWQQRVPILFREGEIDEAGRELVSAAKLIRDLDSGELHPVRHATTMTCPSCRYRDICPAPEDELYVDTLFERSVPKRDRQREDVAA